eukprot:Anaeramoba_ignava/c19530_g1_i1.p2 GENE.c19530_g1_i1~~c19530_g1_i1.p2  ORF type:complete len:271 (+),score=46.20 c19530_g1_i1:1112-1924(+)
MMAHRSHNFLEHNVYLKPVKGGKGRRRSRTPRTQLEIDEEAERAFREIAEFRYRQTFMFTATMSPGVERIAQKFLRDPVVVRVGEGGKVVDTVEQEVLMTKEFEKKDKLLEILDTAKPPVIVFVNTVHKADSLSKSLDKLGFHSVCIHGRKSQDQREAAMDRFRDGLADILVATDVASRGLDIDSVTHVINFDMAKSIDDYIHRVGRTARAGKSGIAVTFLTLDDNEIFFDFRNLLKSSSAQIPYELDHHPDALTKLVNFTSFGDGIDMN